MSDQGRGSHGRPHDSRGSSSNDPHVQIPEQPAEENAFSRPVCPCEEEEPEPMSEYDVPGEWVTYTGVINQTVFEYASRHAENETGRILRDMEEAARTQMIPEYHDAHQTELLSESSSSEQSSKDAPSKTFDLAAPTANSFGEEAASVTDEAADAEEVTASLAEEAVSAVEEAASAAEEVASAAEEAVSAKEEEASVTEEAASAAEEDASAAEEAASATEGAASGAEEAASGAEEAVSMTKEAAIVVEKVAGTAAKAASAVEQAPADETLRFNPTAIEVPSPGAPAEGIPITSEQVVSVAATSALGRNAAGNYAEDELLDEWEVFMAFDNARDAADKAEQAFCVAREAHRRADAAELAGARNAALLAREAHRFDIYAAQARQMAINAEAKAKRIAQMVAQTKESALNARDARLQAVDKVAKE